MKKDKKKEN